MHIFQETKYIGRAYGLFEIAVKSIVKATSLKPNEYDLNNNSDRHIILDVKIKESMHLTCGIEIEKNKGVVIVIIEELLK